MRYCVAPLAAMLFALCLTTSAQAAASGSEFTISEIEVAAKAMNVSTEQATEDLAVQHEARETITELMNAGDHVWFDNKTATIHVHGAATPHATVAASVAGHIVHDSALHRFPAQQVVTTAASCGTASSEYCTPLKPGVELYHKSGSPEVACTAGFMVRDYSGNPYMVTAGHCNIWGTTFYGNPYKSWTWPEIKECEPGPSVSGASPWSGYDAAITPISGCGGVTPYIHNFETGSNTHQEGATNTQYVGEYVCHWGISSLHQCGEDVAANVSSTINYEDTGSGVWSIKETDQVCGYAAPGDSGGPVTSGVYKGDATGILLAVGSDSSCPGGTLWVEQRIFAVLNLFNVYVAAS